MKIELKNLHTIIMLVGVSGSGKSTLARQIDKLAKEKGLRSVILSSDECRHELLLDNTHHHHDPEMEQVSDKAFELLMHKAELYLEWPHNANLMIMDMMNIQTEGRQKIVDLANKYCYDIIAIVMDYPSIEDYFSGLDDKYNKRIITRQLHKFHRVTLPELGRRLFNDMIRIKTKSEPIELECNFPKSITGTILPNDKHYFIVGDIHECIESFKALLLKVGFSIEAYNDNGKKIEKITGREDTRIVLLGDFLDKGYKTKETIEFLYNNIDRINVVEGGHENFAYRFLNGGIKNQNVDKTYHASIQILDNDEELRMEFFELYKNMKPFYQGKYFTVTHAGCESKFIGKTQVHAIKAQRYYNVERFDCNIDDEIWLNNRREALKYLKEESESCRPFHIFGHEAWKNCMVYKNKINLDTGCVNGGRLTGIEINKWNGRYKLYHVNCLDKSEKTEKEVLREFSFEKEKIELEELSDRDYRRLLRYAKNKINFISGTMCPSDKASYYIKNENTDENMDENIIELESIDKALDYFKNKGLDKVMVQIKYMGSRCNIYLFDDIEKSYAVSRNGYKINDTNLKEDLISIYKKLRERLDYYFKENDLEMIIIDGEIMPWSVLGENLIDKTFNAIYKGVSSELSLLKNNGFEEQLEKLKIQYKESQFDNDGYNMKKEDLYKKYGPQKYESYKLLSGFYMPDIDELLKWSDLYYKQLNVYARKFDPEQMKHEINYQAFSILKSVKKNGEEIYYFDSDNEQLFKMVNDAEYIICDLVYPEGYEKARKFFDYVTKELKLEGVVVKSIKVDSSPGCAPYMKVRSPDYLTIIYGYDYLNKIKYNKLFNQKNINMKLRTSIEEWKLGRKLLKIPYKDISEKNSQYMDLMTKMIIETNVEETIDPRL
jgi:predicted kinase